MKRAVTDELMIFLSVTFIKNVHFEGIMDKSLLILHPMCSFRAENDRMSALFMNQEKSHLQYSQKTHARPGLGETVSNR